MPRAYRISTTSSAGTALRNFLMNLATVASREIDDPLVIKHQDIFFQYTEAVLQEATVTKSSR
jgi:hypothetical protein